MAGMRVRAVAAALLSAVTASCASGRPAPEVEPPTPRQAVIADLQAFQVDLGIERTDNFQEFSGERDAVYRCYFTGLLELPASYTDLQLIESDVPECAVDEAAFDVFFYPIEAVASGSSPVSPALEEAPLERALVVVTHEDFHNQRETARASVEVAESAATLIGFLTARDYALARYGETSDVFRRLDGEAERHLLKARTINAYFDRLAALYAEHAAGTLDHGEALARKAEMYAELARECRAADQAVSFNTCPAVMNNAGLAFDRTYARHYATWFDLHVSLGRDTARTITASRQLLATGPQSGGDLKAALRTRPVRAPTDTVDGAAP